MIFFIFYFKLPFKIFSSKSKYLMYIFYAKLLNFRKKGKDFPNSRDPLIARKWVPVKRFLPNSHQAKLWASYSWISSQIWKKSSLRPLYLPIRNVVAIRTTFISTSASSGKSIPNLSKSANPRCFSKTKRISLKRFLEIFLYVINRALE